MDEESKKENQTNTSNEKSAIVDDFVVAIKPEFRIVQVPQKKNKAEESNVIDEPEQKKRKVESRRNRGQNKNRPNTYQVTRENELCHTLIDVRSEKDTPRKCTFEKCTCIHDIQKYLELKETDISDRCHNFDTFGYCSRGLSCRFGASHIDADGFNKVDFTKISTEQIEQMPGKQHHLLDIFQSLRKKSYDFSRAHETIKIYDLQRTAIKESHGVITDEDFIRIRNCERKKFSWTDQLYLSPLTTVGNLPFRRICKEFGADITCGEMAMCDSILKGSAREWALAKRHESETVFGIQVCAGNPHIFSRAAQILVENCDFDFVDLNLGCPLDTVYQSGCGCGLLQRTRNLESILYCANRLIDKPFTIKTRIGIQKDENIVHTFMPKFKEFGVSMITIHGRTRVQRYTKSADWDYVNQCALLADPIPVFGNGDIFNFEDYNRAKDTYKNVSGVMIGRGALIKPWIFSEIKEQKFIDISSAERFDILRKFTNYGLEHWGSDNRGVENTRKFLLEWLSFLHRYVPVGILERQQRINERPPQFFGRNELETLMGSTSCSDWIRISEMLLGKVPDEFKFIPKHKANAYTGN